MKNKWGNYAVKGGKVQQSYIRQYSNRKKVGQTTETSHCDSTECCGQIKQEEVNESIRKEISLETHQERRQRVSQSDKRRCQIEEPDHEIKTGEEEMKKPSAAAKEKKHEAKESKAYEKKEDKKEAKKGSKK